METYWLLRWLDEQGIADLDVVRGVLRTKDGYDSLRNLAIEESRAPYSDLPRSANMLVGGAGFELAGNSVCGEPRCLKKRIDELILRSWYYFDTVVVTGYDPVDFLTMEARDDKGYVIRKLLDYLEVALYVREIGAEDYLTITKPRAYCTEHLNEHAREVGLAPVRDLVEGLAGELSVGYKLHLRETRRGLEFEYTHPILGYVRTGRIRKRKTRKQLARSLAGSEARANVAVLIRNVGVARDARAALGQATALKSRTLCLPVPGEMPTPGEVAFDLRLPVLAGASPAHILAVRQDEGNEFEVFRAAIKKAIEERIGVLPNADSNRVAESVSADVLAPALAGLERRMHKVAETTRRRTAAAVVSGGVLTTVGLLAFAPLTVPGLLLTAGGLVSNHVDLLKDRRDIELSDMHFLWRLKEESLDDHR